MHCSIMGLGFVRVMKAKLNQHIEMRKMKKKETSNFLWRGLGILSLAFIPFLTSCLDDKDGQMDPVPEAYVSFYHGSPSTSALTIEVDHQRYNTNLFDYNTYFDYGRFYTGKRNFSFKSQNAANSLLDTAVTFEADKVYSFFISEEDNGFVPVIVEDEFKSVPEGKALIRLVHLSPDAESVNVKVGDDGELLFEDQTYQEVSEYTEIEQGRIDFDLRASASDENLLTASNINISEGRIYTLVVRGYVDASSGSDNTLSLQLIRNYPNY